MNCLSRSYRTMPTDPYTDLGETFDHSPRKRDQNRPAMEPMSSPISLVVAQLLPHPKSFMLHLGQIPARTEAYLTRVAYSLPTNKKDKALSVDWLQFFFFFRNVILQLQSRPQICLKLTINLILQNEQPVNSAARSS